MAFTIKELREMTKLPECRFVADPTQFTGIRDILPGEWVWLYGDVSSAVIMQCRIATSSKKVDRTYDKVSRVGLPNYSIYLSTLYLLHHISIPPAPIFYPRTLELSSFTSFCSQGGAGGGAKRECRLSFLRSPVELLADPSHGRVARLRMEINRLEVSWHVTCM